MADNKTSAAPAARRRLFYFLKLAIGLAIVAFLFYKYDLSKVATAMLQLGPKAMFWIWFYTLLGLWFHSLMLQGTLRPLNMKFTVLRLFVINLQIRFYALFLPGAANVVIKWQKLAKPGAQPAQALAVIAFTRIAHTLAVLLLAVTGMAMDGVFPWPSVQWLTTGLLFLTAACMALSTSKRLGPRLDRMADSILRRMPGPQNLRDKLNKIWAAFRGFRGMHLHQIGSIIVLTVVGQAFQTLGQIEIAHAVGADVSFWTQLWIRGVVLVCSTLPITLSGLGLREASMVGLLVFYGISPEIALAYSLGWFGLTVLLGLLGSLLDAKEHFLPGKDILTAEPAREK